MNRVLPIVHVLGRVVLIFAFALLLPVATAYYFEDAAILEYDEAFVITFLSGSFMWLGTRHKKRDLQIKDGFLLVVLVWTVLPVFAAIPLLFQFPHLSFAHAYFETVSAMTTTGATVLTGLDAMPESINLWRHQLQWMGGMGIIVLAVAILPLLGVGGRQMFKAETPGPMKDSKLTPRIADTAKALWLVYAVITLACILSLHLAGMRWFDAVCHAFSAMSLGGFSTHDASIGHYDSVPIEIVLTVFQILAAANFATHFLAWREKSLDPYRRDSELVYMLALLALSILGASAYLVWAHTYPDFLVALRYVSFNLVTIGVASGYASTDFGQWPIFVPMWMLLLASITACSGSTGGGIKMIRTLLMVKQGIRELERQLHPKAMLPVKIGGLAVSSQVVFAIQAFVMLYLTTVLLSTFLLLASGLDFISALSASLACISNAGPGLSEVGPASNYAGLGTFQSWVLIAVMLLGRLELFTFFVLLTRSFWKS
jgi:trk system potassium uptake protein TrkH